MCHKLDKRFFEELAAMDEAEVCRRALCRYDHEQGCFMLDAWGTEHEVYPGLCEIRSIGDDAPPVNIETGLSIIFYLLRAQETPLKNEWISDKDMPGGVGFFRGPHAIPTHLITERFGDNVQGFRAACKGLEGTVLDMADASFSFRVLPRVPVTALLWAGDDEFPARAQLLFDRSIYEHLPLDVIFGVSVELCSRIAGS